MGRSQQCQKYYVLNVNSTDDTLRLAEREWLLGKFQNPRSFPHNAAFGVFPNQTQFWILSFNPTDPEDPTQAVRLASKLFYPLSLPSCWPNITFINVGVDGGGLVWPRPLLQGVPLLKVVPAWKPST